MVEYSVTGATYCPQSVHGETHLTICHSMSLNMILTAAELKNNSICRNSRTHDCIIRIDTKQ